MEKEALGEADCIFNASELTESLSGNVEMIIKVLRIFLNEIPIRINNIIDDLTRNNIGDIKSNAHTIKGSALNIGAKTLADIASALERAGIAGNLEQCKSLAIDLVQYYEETGEAIKKEFPQLV